MSVQTFFFFGGKVLFENNKLEIHVIATNFFFLVFEEDTNF
jgi:hypothetical protein